MQWIAVNLFLLLLIGVGAGTFFVLGSLVKWAHVSTDLEPYLYSIVALASIFASYYCGKFLHDLANRRKS